MACSHCTPAGLWIHRGRVTHPGSRLPDRKEAMYHYDAIPYESLPFAETHPQRLAVLGRLLGLNVAAPQQCRVLELGSAAGGNLIPMAWYQPDSEFVGIELEAGQVRAGQRQIDELGIHNVRLLQGDILQLGDELGQFDYIIAHGVYSWVPDIVSEALLKLCRDRLQPNGIAYISFNTLPGWRVRGMVREMLLFHVREITEPVERLNTALAFIQFLIESLPQQKNPLTQHLLVELKYLLNAHPSYVYHEFLEENNRAVLFTDFVAQAERNGLRYLCESQLSSMFGSAYGQRIDAFLDTVAGTIESEQYLDFFTQRTFRQTLLCHAEARPDYDIDLAGLDQFACYAQLKPPAKIESRPNKPQKFTSQNGKEYDVEAPILKFMLKHMFENYPNAVSVPALVAIARQQCEAAAKNKHAVDDKGWRGELFSLVANNAVQLRTEPLCISALTDDKPRVNTLVKVQAHEGNNLTSVHHETVYTDAFTQRLVNYLDGSRSLDTVCTQLILDMRAGNLSLPGLNLNTLSLEQLTRQVSNNIQRLVDLFARNGMLTSQVLFSEGHAA